MKMIRHAVMRTAKGKLRAGERKIFERPALAPQACHKFVAQIETFGSANGGHAAESWERWRLASVFSVELAGGDAGAPREKNRAINVGWTCAKWRREPWPAFGLRQFHAPLGLS
jgi:hypothetical protein